MDTEKQLKKIFNIILDEVKTNPEFAKRIESALANERVETKSKKRGRQPAVINPNIVALQGEEILRMELEKLEAAQLKDIISQYAMDPSKLTSKWRSKEKLINHIKDIVIARSKKGDVFR